MAKTKSIYYAFFSLISPSIYKLCSFYVSGIGSFKFLVIHGCDNAWYTRYLSEMPLANSLLSSDWANGLMSNLFILLASSCSMGSLEIRWVYEASSSPLKKKGCLPVSIWYIMTPIAHISTLLPYLFPVACSGAINKMVPVTELILSWPVNTFECTSAVSPKSAIFAWYVSNYVGSSLSNMLRSIFSGLRSLWI